MHLDDDYFEEHERILVKNRPRKLKKAVDSALLIVDVNSIPKGMDVERYFKIFKQTGILLFDASRPHHSTTCTNATRRLNINFNYF